MFERFLAWVRSLFAGTKDPLASLDATWLGDQVKLLDIERQKTVDAIERRESLRAQLKSRAQEEIRLQGEGVQSVRLVELARQIGYVDEEINDKRDHLNQIHQQRRAVNQFVRFAERAELMKRYGLDKILGRHIDLVRLEKAIENSVSGGVLDTESLGQAENMLRDALASTRLDVEDPSLIKVLDEIAGGTHFESIGFFTKEQAAQAAPTDDEVRAVLRELESDR